MKRALISVSDKSGIFEFANALIELGYEILSTGGTGKALREKGLKITDVAAYTGSPEILDGRVKTLHPKIHGGLLGRRQDPRHVAEMANQGIAPIDLVAVNLYPFAATISKPGCTFEEAVENIDIGGPSMLRSAAKNHVDVTVVVDPADYPRVLDALRDGGVPLPMRVELACKVFQHTAQYDARISGYLEAQAAGASVKFPSLLSLQFEKVNILRYGENPHQQGAFYRELASDEVGIARGRQLHGKEMSYNNFLDANAALELVKEFAASDVTVPPREGADAATVTSPPGAAKIAAVIVKHNNPCGAAIGETPSEAYVRARETDPISAFGGVVAFNAKIDLATAKDLTGTFLEVLVAPGFDPDALAELKRKKDLRLIEVGPLHDERRSGLDAHGHEKDCWGTDPPGPGPWRHSGHSGAQGGLETPAHRRRIRGLRVRLEGVQACEIECHRVRARRSHDRDRSGPDEPRRLRQAGYAEGSLLPRGLHHGFRCVFSVQGWDRCCRASRHYRRDSTRGIDPRSGNRAGGGRAQHGDGTDRHAPFSPLAHLGAGSYRQIRRFMKILIVGSGGREHALAWKIAHSPAVTKAILRSRQRRNRRHCRMRPSGGR